MRRPLALMLCFILCSVHCFAWNSFGHMAVGWVAYKHLNPNTKRAVNELIAKNPSYSQWKKSFPGNISNDDRDLYIFMLATTWPDQIKGDSSYQDDGTKGGIRLPRTAVHH